jgi:hypothetical protein
MDRLHVLGAGAAASMPAVRRRVSFDPAYAFSFRFWWYDVQQVEGAV